jgi:hypothetical protein
MNNPLDVNTGLPIFLLTNNHPEKFFERSTYRFEPQAVTNVNKLKQIFFSTENIKYIQEKLRYEVFASSNNRYRIPYQNERDLRMIMETIYFDKTRNIGYDLNEQLNELNLYVVKFCVPLIINEIKVYLNYLDDINKPRNLNLLPQSTGNLRSVSGITPPTNLNENIFLPNNEMKYSYSTNGDVKKYDNPVPVKLTPSIASQNPANIYTGTPSTISNTPEWLPSAVLFQDDPYYIRNSLLSPYSVRSHKPAKTFPKEENDLVSAAEGSNIFLPNDFDIQKYAQLSMPKKESVQKQAKDQEEEE